MKPWHTAWWPEHPRACFLVAVALSVIAGLWLAESSNAAVYGPPTTQQVTHRMGRATEQMLDRRGMRVAGIVGAACQPGTRGDATRKLRWWCLLWQRDEVGAVVWRSRVALRWHRATVDTVVTWRMEGKIRMTKPVGGHFSSRRF